MITFHKMHGLGNDFIVLDGRGHRFQPDAQWCRRMADRQLGIGCDQVLLLEDCANDGALAGYRVWNADGSQAEQCGNGVRCLGLFLRMTGEAGDGAFRLAGPAGGIRLQCLSGGQVRVNMGEPRFEPRLIPIDFESRQASYPLQTSKGTVHIGAVSMGNPHAVLVAGEGQPGWSNELGEEISSHPFFPQGCNAGFARVEATDLIRLRVWERGGGPTRACGSGACAAVAVLRQRGELAERVTVEQRGGKLVIEWRGPGTDLWMTGPAVYVFKGHLEDDKQQ